MPAAEDIENPYASPMSVELRPDPDALLRATTSLYRGMGWFGIVYHAVVYSFAMISEGSKQRPEMPPIIGMTIVCGLMVAYFFFMIRVANRLKTNFDRNYRPTRWMGILTATIFFPMLTIPAILAVRRLERYRKRRTATTDDLRSSPTMDVLPESCVVD